MFVAKFANSNKVPNYNTIQLALITRLNKTFALRELVTAS